MAKGIRSAVNAKFVELLPKRVEMGNVAFRAAVMNFAVAEFGISTASASTHYNHAFKVARNAGEAVGDLGRAEDKKGGRKPKGEAKLVNVVRKKDNAVVATGVTVSAAKAMIAKAVKGKKAALIALDPTGV